jgi:hypothetical protein
MVLKYFHTKCETIIHNLKHTLGSRENYVDYFSHPKVHLLTLHTQHTTHNTQHTTHNTQHTTHNTQHTTHNTQHTTSPAFFFSSLSMVRGGGGTQTGDPTAPEELRAESGLVTVGLLRSCGIEELVRRYKVAVTRHPSLPHLVHLYSDVRRCPLPPLLQVDDTTHTHTHTHAR